MTTTTQPTGAAFSRKRITRIAAGVASAGVMAGFSLLAAAPAAAATDADCLPEFTVDATTGGTVADVQVLLDASEVLICLVGEFEFAPNTPLLYNYDVTLHGFPSAVLNGLGASRILEDTGPDDGNQVVIENLRVTGGDGNGNGDGGAINGDEVAVYNSTFDNNSGGDGGAIWAYGTVQVFNSTFDNNTANGDDDGGAIRAGDDIYVTDSTFSNNHAGAGAALSAPNFSSSIYVDSSTFVANVATGSEETEEGSPGGAVLAYYASVVNSTFVENSAQYGGAIAAYGSDITQSTFLDNSADAAQSVSLIGDGGFSNLLANIFANHSDLSELGVQYETEEFTDLGANIFSTQLATETSLPAPDASTAFDVSASELFDGAGLASNGGPTQTVALYDKSPAVNFVQFATVPVDQRDVPRDERPDSGAYEYVGPAPAALPNMGSEPAWWVGIAGAVLVALGGAAFFVSRRVKRTH